MAGAQRLVTFLNASLQGMDKFLRVLGGAGAYQKALSLVFDKTSSKKLTSLERDNLAAARSLYTKMMVLGLIGVGLTSLYRDDPEYQEISDYLRASHWLVKVPGGKWLVIPKPFQEAVLSNIFERVYEMYYYNDPAAMDRLLNGIALSMGPPMVPVFARPIIEHFGNKSIYNGMPLISQRLNGLEPEQQFYSWTSSFAKKAGEALGVSPILIDHYITSYTGTLGRTVLGFTSASDPQAPDQGPDDMFFVRRFIRDYTRSSVSNKAFYEKMARDGGELNAKYLTFRNFVRNDSDDEARDYLRKMSGEESVYVMARFTGYLKPSASQRKFHPLERAQDVAGSIYSLRREVRASTTLSPRVKQRVDDALSERVVMEFRNAMIATGVRGYKGRGMMDLGKNDRKIKIGSKAVYEELQALVSKYPDAESTYNDYEAFSEAMLGQRDDVLESNGDIDQRAANDFDG